MPKEMNLSDERLTDFYAHLPLEMANELGAYISALRKQVEELEHRHVRFMITGGPVVMATEFDALKERAESAEAQLKDERACGFAMSAEMEMLREELKELQERERWIPVSERLPELENHGGRWESAVALVMASTGTPDIAWMDNQNTWERFWGGVHIAKPTHWRPLPAPPETEATK